MALARFMSALMIGQIVGSTLGGIFGEYLGWRYIFVVFGIVALAVSALLAREGGDFRRTRTAARRLGPAILTVPLGGTLIFVGLLGVAAGRAGRSALEALARACLVYALATQYGGMLRRPTAPLVLGTVMLEGLFVFGGLAYLASSLTDRFGINYAYAGLMVAGFGCGGLIYSVSAKKLVPGAGELGVLLLGGTLLGVAFVFIGVMPSWHWFVPAVIVLGMGYYTMHGTLQTRATELAPQARGTAISLFAFFFFLGQATGPQLLGRILKSHGYAGRIHRRRHRPVHDRAPSPECCSPEPRNRSRFSQRRECPPLGGPDAGPAEAGHFIDVNWDQCRRVSCAECDRLPSHSSRCCRWRRHAAARPIPAGCVGVLHADAARAAGGIRGQAVPHRRRRRRQGRPARSA